MKGTILTLVKGKCIEAVKGFLVPKNADAAIRLYEKNSYRA